MKKSILKTGKRAAQILIISLLFIACGPKDHEPKFPDLPVLFRVDFGIDIALESPMGKIIFTKPRIADEMLGLGGLLVVRSSDLKTIYAFDAACPNEKDTEIKLEMIKDDAKSVMCGNCKSTFSVYGGFGNVTKGESKRSLKKYKVIPSAEGVYRIVN